MINFGIDFQMVYYKTLAFKELTKSIKIIKGWLAENFFKGVKSYWIGFWRRVKFLEGVTFSPMFAKKHFFKLVLKSKNTFLKEHNVLSSSQNAHL